MNGNAAFRRKIIYIGLIAALVPALFLVGSPARRDEGRLVGGGYLSKLRDEYHLSQTGLGQVDPAGEAMRLACLGMRGPATCILWQKCNHYKMTEQFDAMAATVDQIMKLQPNFISVWEFHAHNLSFNTSVEYDDFRFRYHWVKRGLEFLVRGIEYNQEDSRLMWSLGWYTEHKIGRSDETTQYRELFREDTDFHDQVLRKRIPRWDDTMGPDGRPDSWLVGRQFLLKAQDLVDNKGAQIRGQSKLTFHASPTMSLCYYAMTIGKEGYLEDGRLAWAKAADAWERYGQREIVSSRGFPIRLADQEKFQRQMDDYVAELDELLAGIRERMRQQKYETELNDEERAALETPADERTPEQEGLAAKAKAKLVVSHESVAAEAPKADRAEARRLLRLIADRDAQMSIISSYRGIVNYDYWKTRCAAERTETAVKARGAVYEADRKFDEDLDFVGAQKLYEEAWVHWAKIFEEHPALLEDVSAEDVIDSIQNYRRCLEQAGEPFPDPFILRGLLDLHKRLYPSSRRIAGIPDPSDRSDTPPESANENDDSSGSDDEPSEGDPASSEGDPVPENDSSPGETESPPETDTT